MVLAALVAFSINTFSPAGNSDGLDIVTIQAKKKIHQLPDLLDQQIAILMGLDTNPNWVRKQNATDSLIYGIMKPNDTVPAGINEDHNYLVISNRGKEASPLSKADKKRVTIKYVDHGEELHTKTVPLSWLVKQSYQTKK